MLLLHETHKYIWPDLRKPGMWDERAIHAMCIFSTSGQYLPNFSFCHFHIQKPFFNLLPLVTKAKYKSLRRNKPFLTSVLIYLVRPAASAQSPLLWALIRIHASELSRYHRIHWSTEQRRTLCTWYAASKKLRWQSLGLRSVFGFISDDSALTSQ